MHAFHAPCRARLSLAQWARGTLEEKKNGRGPYFHGQRRFLEVNISLGGVDRKNC